MYLIAGWIWIHGGTELSPFQMLSGAGCLIFDEIIFHAKKMWSGLDKSLSSLTLFPSIPMGHETTVYLPLVSNPSSLEECSTRNEYNSKTRYYGLALREVVLLFIILVQAVALAISMFSCSHATQMLSICPHSDSPLLYCKCSIVDWNLLQAPWPFVLAPAQVALEYEVKSFTAGRTGHKTIYQGLSDDVDRAWGMLYNRQCYLIDSCLLQIMCL